MLVNRYPPPCLGAQSVWSPRALDAPAVPFMYVIDNRMSNETRHIVDQDTSEQLTSKVNLAKQLHIGGGSPFNIHQVPGWKYMVTTEPPVDECPACPF